MYARSISESAIVVSDNIVADVIHIWPVVVSEAAIIVSDAVASVTVKASNIVETVGARLYAMFNGRHMIN
jgi:hypothetical protein